MPLDTSATPALVLGAGLTVLGTIRSLARAGIPAFCAHKQPPFVEASRWCRYLDAGTIPLAPDEGVRALDALPLAHAVVMPTSDHWCHEVAGWPDARRRRFPASIPTQSVLDTLLDKNAFALALERLGLPHPWTRHVRSDADVGALGADIPAGSFLKPCDSQAFNKVFHAKAFATTSAADLREKLTRIRAADLECIIQEYIPGPPTNHYFVDGFVDREGRITALVARRRARMYPIDFGNSTMLVSVPIEEVQGAVDTIRRLTGALGYRGIFSAEFKKDERDHVFKILEVNCRPWWFVELATACGVNVVSMAYRDALGFPVTPVTAYRSGVRFCYLTYDWLAYQHLQAQGAISGPAWVRSWLFGRHAVFSWADPVPAFLPFQQRMARRVRNRWNRLMASS